MAPDDERHGTTRGHAAGCREACCRAARNADESRRRKYREVLGIVRTVDATGTHRRIEALWAIGWTSADIAKAAGWASPQAVTELMKRECYVFTTSAQTIGIVYDRLSGKPGPSTTNRRRARAKGWAPPLAWDDIDNDQTPKGVRGAEMRTRHDAQTWEDYDELAVQGYSREHAARRLGMTKAALEKALARRPQGDEVGPVENFREMSATCGTIDEGRHRGNGADPLTRDLLQQKGA